MGQESSDSQTGKAEKSKTVVSAVIVRKSPPEKYQERDDQEMIVAQP
jgi:hypothetical protein